MGSIFLCSGDGGKFAVPRYIAGMSKTCEKMMADLPTTFTQLHFPELTGPGLENVRLGWRKCLLLFTMIKMIRRSLFANEKVKLSTPAVVAVRSSFTACLQYIHTCPYIHVQAIQFLFYKAKYRYVVQVSETLMP